jgi:hypothetical protein
MEQDRPIDFIRNLEAAIAAQIALVREFETEGIDTTTAKIVLVGLQQSLRSSTELRHRAAA